MTNIYDRFLALPRGRRGKKTVIVVDEDVLAELLTDAVIAETSRVQLEMLAAQRAMTHSIPRTHVAGIDPADQVTPGPDKPKIQFVETVRTPVPVPRWLRNP